jgi:16S rRNA G527 N7-methylase RsmG
MTDEEREKLCAQLRYMHNEWYCDHCDLEPCETAADEIERLAKRVAELEAMPPELDVQMTNFRQKAEECYAAFKETYDPAEAAAADAYNEAANEIERLVKENGQLKDIIHQMNCDLMEAKRYDMRDWHDALERGRKNPI